MTTTISARIRAPSRYRPPYAPARKRLLSIGVALPVEPLTVRDTIRRELYLRELAMPDLAVRLGVTERCIFERLALGTTRQPTRMTPKLLNSIIAALHIDPTVGRRLHLRAAREAGWEIP